MKKRLLVMLLILCMLCPIASYAEVKSYGFPALSDQQKETADKIANYVANHWEENGVLPSVAVAQAYQESSFIHYRGYNLWGINSGATTYSSLEDGIEHYMDVINLHYYKGAPYKKDYATQLKIILDGGYCQPVGDYYAITTGAIQHYDWDKYDKKMFDDIHKAKIKAAKLKKAKKIAKIKSKKQSETYTVKYDAALNPRFIGISSKVASKGTITLWKNNAMMGGIYEVINGYGNVKYKDDNVIYTSNPDITFLIGHKVKIEVVEGARG